MAIDRDEWLLNNAFEMYERAREWRQLVDSIEDKSSAHARAAAALVVGYERAAGCFSDMMGKNGEPQYCARCGTNEPSETVQLNADGSCPRCDVTPLPWDEEDQALADGSYPFARRCVATILRKASDYEREADNESLTPDVRRLNAAGAAAISDLMATLGLTKDATDGPVAGARAAAECVLGRYCARHGFIHGYEAEELRSGVEKLISGCTSSGYDGVPSDSLRALLDRVDARDSLAYQEASASEPDGGELLAVMDEVREELKAEGVTVDAERFTAQQQQDDADDRRLCAKVSGNAPPPDDCGPPWTVVGCDGAPIAIVPSGRPGDVVELKDTSYDAAERLAACANAAERGAYGRLERISEELKAIVLAVHPEAEAAIYGAEPEPELPDFVRKLREIPNSDVKLMLHHIWHGPGIFSRRYAIANSIEWLRGDVDVPEKHDADFWVQFHRAPLPREALIEWDTRCRVVESLLGEFGEATPEHELLSRLAETMRTGEAGT